MSRTTRSWIGVSIEYGCELMTVNEMADRIDALESSIQGTLFTG